MTTGRINQVATTPAGRTTNSAPIRSSQLVQIDLSLSHSRASQRQQPAVSLLSFRTTARCQRPSQRGLRRTSKLLLKFAFRSSHRQIASTSYSCQRPLKKRAPAQSNTVTRHPFLPVSSDPPMWGSPAWPLGSSVHPNKAFTQSNQNSNVHN